MTTHAQYAVKITVTSCRRTRSAQTKWLSNKHEAERLFDRFGPMLAAGEFAALLKRRPDTGKVSEIQHYLAE